MDLRGEEGRDIVRRLAAGAGVFPERPADPQDRALGMTEDSVHPAAGRLRQPSAAGVIA